MCPTPAIRLAARCRRHRVVGIASCAVLFTATRPHSVAVKAFGERLAALRMAPSYLRHAPPTQYYTVGSSGAHPADSMEEEPLLRHRTLLLDEITWRNGEPLVVTGGAAPANPVKSDVSSEGDAPAILIPHTRGVYVLHTTGADDLHFAKPEERSTALVGLPYAECPEEVEKFVQVHRAALEGLQRVYLPEVSLSTGCILHLLKKHFPQLRVICSGFGRELLLNQNFYEQWLKQTKNEAHSAIHAAGAMRDWLHHFEPLSDEMVAAVPAEGGVYDFTSSNDNLDASSRSPSSTPRRPLHAIPVGREHEKESRRASDLPAHFTNRPVFFYDAAFHAVLVGTALLRWPWLPHLPQGSQAVESALGRRAGFPTPPPLTAARTVPLGPLKPYWSVPATTAAISQAIRSLPLRSAGPTSFPPERVLSAQFGELPGHVEDVLRGLEESRDALLAMQGRVGRMAQRMDAARRQKAARDEELTRRIHRKLVLEAVLGLPEPPPASPHAMDSSTTDGSAAPVDPAVSGVVEWCTSSLGGLDQNAWWSLSQCLHQSALGLPPPADERQEKRSHAEKSEGTVVEAEVASELIGAEGVALLREVFALKGLEGLNKVVKQQDIDASVFMGMTAEELQKVFKPTFGVLKRLQGLQIDMQKKTKGLQTDGTPSKKFPLPSSRGARRDSQTSRVVPHITSV